MSHQPRPVPGGPDLSVVVTARNDDHGGDLLRRMQIFLDAWCEQVHRHNLVAELIIVEWNPPPGRPRLAEALRWPRFARPSSVRIIEVPPEIHSRYQSGKWLGLLQMIAKNVGIRRARGRFVLCTNVDLLFSDDLVRFLASGHFDRRCLYRVNRVDVEANVPLGVPVARQLEYCRQHALRINTRWGTFRIGERWWLVIAGRVRVWIRNPFRRQDRRFWDRVREALGHAARIRDFVWPLHTNGCGDFTLMAREYWTALRGYPEWDMFSIHLDSVLCQMAVHAGAREVVLGRGRLAFHIEHAAGWSPGEAERLIQRLRSLGVPFLETSKYQELLDEMRKRRGVHVVNSEHWGLATEQFKEIDPLAPSAEQVLGMSTGRSVL
jgi:hypothetical protein